VPLICARVIGQIEWQHGIKQGCQLALPGWQSRQLVPQRCHRLTACGRCLRIDLQQTGNDRPQRQEGRVGFDAVCCARHLRQAEFSR
jgi:hypothetical protein